VELNSLAGRYLRMIIYAKSKAEWQGSRT